MQLSVDHVDFKGTHPSLIGQVCTGFAVQHFYAGVTLVDQANVVFLRFGHEWHRICFETATVFWRSGLEPESLVNSTLDHGLLLNDLTGFPGVVGHALESITYAGTVQGDVTVEFSFSGGGGFSLRYDNGADATVFAPNNSLKRTDQSLRD